MSDVVLQAVIETCQRSIAEAKTEGDAETAGMYTAIIPLIERCMKADNPHDELVIEMLASLTCVLSWHAQAMMQTDGAPEILTAQHIQALTIAFANMLISGCGLQGMAVTSLQTAPADWPYPPPPKEAAH